MIDAHRIAPRLWMGSRPPEGDELRKRNFDVLILAAKEYQPPESRFPGLRVWHAPIDDPTSQFSRKDLQTARVAANYATKHILRGRRVLVTCNMGWNRSGFIVALTLRNLYGWSGDIIVMHMRLLRPGVLRNPIFVKMVSRLL